MLADTEEVALTFENSNLGQSNSTVQTDKIRHPIALFFHLLFRTLAILLFIFANVFYKSFIVVFVIIIILLSADFWTVKNITGRLLVGLRWWNYVDENGKSSWVFENRKTNQNKNNIMPVLESTYEASIFWSSLIVTDLIWIALFIITFFSLNFKWMIIIIVALMLNGSNTYGFLKCRYGSENNMQSAATNFFGKQMFKSMYGRFTGNSNPLTTAMAAAQAAAASSTQKASSQNTI